jgi:transposase InsO family protein
VLVISWGVGTRPTAALANTMLAEAISVLKNNEKPTIHTDRRGHYRWPSWLKRMQGAKLVRSMSREGCSPDNAACEAFFGRLKTEFYCPHDWSNKTIEELMHEINSYILWYNQKRIKISLDSKSPIDYRLSLGYSA